MKLIAKKLVLVKEGGFLRSELLQFVQLIETRFTTALITYFYKDSETRCKYFVATISCVLVENTICVVVAVVIVVTTRRFLFMLK